MNRNTNLEETAAQITNQKLVGNKYYIKSHLFGRGQIGETYLATLKDNEKVIYACKIIPKNQLINKFYTKQCETNEMFTNLKKQANFWKQLDHPNIVKCIDITETNNNFYFFLEYCNGGDLEMLLRHKDRLSEIDAIDIFQQISDCFCYLKDLNIFHSDLKPENILIHNGIPKITDLGIQNFIEAYYKDGVAQCRLTSIPFYQAPQIILGDVYSIKSNVWSLGVFFYRILYGVLPWVVTQSIIQFIDAIKSQQIQFLNIIQVSEGMKDLIIKMLQVKEDDRIDIKGVSESLRKLKE